VFKRSPLIIVATLALAANCFADGSYRRVVGPGVPVDNFNYFSTIRAALTTGGMNPSLVVEIKPGAHPGPLSASDIAAAEAAVTTKLIIRGDLNTKPEELQPILIQDAVEFSRAGTELEHLHIRFLNAGRIINSGNAFRLNNSLVVSDDSTMSNFILGASGGIINSNRFISGSGATILQISSMAIQWQFVGNEVITNKPAINILYDANGGSRSDIIRENSFRGGPGASAAAAISIATGNNGITIEGNDFTDLDAAACALTCVYGCNNINFTSNRVRYTSAVQFGVVSVTSGGAGLGTNIRIIGNDFLCPQGYPVSLVAPATGTFSARIEGNRFRGAAGVHLATAGLSLGSVDLGGGNQSSAGGNDFSYFTTAATPSSGAILAGGGNAAISAQTNIFGTPDPETAIYDAADDAARANVNSGSFYTGNANYVARMYARFKRKPADVDNLAGAGGFVAQLESKKPASGVAKSIVRSNDALGFLVTEAYQSVFRRVPSGTEFADGVLFLSRRREEDFLSALLLKPEGRVIYPSDSTFVHMVYNTFLGRLPTAEELTLQIPAAARSRARVLQSVLRSTEFYVRRIDLVFMDLLGHGPDSEELKKYKAYDRLRLLATIASTPEYIAGQ